MVKQNLANRLAAGGFWAIRMGWMAAEVTDRMRADGIPIPIGDGNPTHQEVFIACSIDAFQMFCNANMDGNRMDVNIQQVLRAGPPPMFDKDCRPITLAQWSELQADNDYRRIAVWRGPGAGVFTVWTGVDPNGCQQPHIFESLVISMTSEGPKIRHIFRYHTISEALMGHHQIVQMIGGSQL